MSSPKKERVDVLAVKQGLAESHEKARALIMAGQVLAGDQIYNKPGTKIPDDTVLRVRRVKDQYVSRGAHKLKKAIEEFSISLQGTVCLDVGASTGGFTQVCLEEGALKVYAVDVGHNQLDWRLRNDPRVVSQEGVNIREVTEEFLPEKVDFICIDTSFISLKFVLSAAKIFLKPNAQMVALIKPQHEVKKENVGKGGLVKDPVLHEQVTHEISAYAQTIGFEVRGLIESPIAGTTGNKEFLIHLVNP